MTNTTATRRTITTPDGFSVVQVQGKNGLWLTESRTFMGHKVGSLCVQRRYGCVGHVVARLGKCRTRDGVLTERLVLVCDRCGQPHGLGDA